MWMGCNELNGWIVERYDDFDQAWRSMEYFNRMAKIDIYRVHYDG